MLEKVAGILLFNKTVAASSRLIHKLVVSLAVVFILALITSALVALLVCGALYAVYQALILHGVTPGTALALVGGLIIALLVAIVTTGILYVHRLRKPSGHGLDSLSERAMSIANAFMDGMLDEHKRR
ncbi:MAG TPA: hypothetical protein VFT64_02500 [Rickettsiales bacterium]|nr:hypothetical protein [Rickettsiales bacterium]